MDLAELKFVVDTKELETAATRVAELGTAVSKLNKPMQDLTKESAKSNKELSKAEEAAAKAALAQHKLEQAQAKSADATSKSTSVLERQTLITKYMADGNSKGQASILATAKAAGALDDEMIELSNTLKLQRTLIGGDPFDKSIGLMQKLTNETKIVTEVNELFNKGLNLTEKQMTDLAREKERLIALYGFEGKSLDGLAAEYDQIVQKSVEINQANDARTNSMKAQVKAQNDAAKANEYIAKEMERVNRLTESNGTLTSATNNKLIKFEQSLKASGMSAADAAAKLELYKQKVLAAQKAGGDRQIDYLSRALGPQITDIFVGLATGQSPLTVMLQQGGQLRDQFALAGVAGADMGKMLVQAGKSMISSVKDVSVAVGQVLVGAFTGTGKAIANFGMELTNSNAIIDRMRASIIATAGVNSVFVRSLGFLGAALAGVSGGIVLAAIASIGALAVGYFKAAKEQDALTRQLTLTGGSLGLNTAGAIDMAQAMNTLGVSTSAAISVITAMAKEGGFVAKEIAVVTKAAVEMEKYAGVAIEDTVKAFSKMKEKPVEALFELAKTTGMVTPEITKMVMELVAQGKSADATALAIKTLADVNAQQVARMKEDYTSLSLGLIEAGSAIKKFFDDTFKDLFFKVSPEKQLKDQIEAIDDILSGNAGVFGIGSLFADKEKYQNLREELTGQLNLIKRSKDLEASRIAQNVKLTSDLEKFNKIQESVATNREKREKEITEVTKRNQGLIAAGLITQQQHEQQIANIREKYKDPKKDESLDYFQGVLLSIEKLTNRNTVAQTELNAAQLKMLELIADPRFTELDQKKQAEALQRLANASATIDEVAALELLRKQNLKVTEEYIKQQADKDKIWFDQMEMSDQATRAVKQETDDLIFQASIIGMTAKAREKAIASRKIELDLIKEKRSIESNTSLSPEQKLEEVAAATDRAAQRTKNLDTAMQNAIGAERMQAYGQAFESVFNGMADALVDFAKTGKLEFGDLISSMIQDLIRFEMRQQMMGMYNNMGGAGTIVSSIAGMFTGTPVASANGNVFNNGSMQAFAKGGTFTNGIVSSPTMFNMGLMGEAGPEAIMPLRRGSDGSLGVVASGGSGGNVSVQVINNSNAQATTNETVDSKGNRKIEVVIGDMTAGELSRSGSASQKSIRSTFGIQPQLIRR